MKHIGIVEVADKAGVSITTVSRVINKSPLVKEKTYNKVKAVMEELGYQPNQVARSLRVNETKTIGVVVSNILNPFFTAVVRGIEDVANETNYNIILCNTDEKPEKEMQYIITLLNKCVDGLIVAATGHQKDYRPIARNKPIVFIDRYPGKDSASDYDVVLVKNCEGSYRLVNHMLDAGYRKIGFICGSDQSTTGYERLKGYRKALSDAGIEYDDSIVKVGDFLGHTSYSQTMEILREKNCDALYAGNNMILNGILKAMQECKLRYPDDLGLASFDDMEWMAYSQPSITAVNQPTYEIGKVAANQLLDRIAGLQLPPKEIFLDVAIHVRESTMRKR